MVHQFCECMKLITFTEIWEKAFRVSALLSETIWFSFSALKRNIPKTFQQTFQQLVKLTNEVHAVDSVHIIHFSVSEIYLGWCDSANFPEEQFRKISICLYLRASRAEQIFPRRYFCNETTIWSILYGLFIAVLWVSIITCNVINTFPSCLKLETLDDEYEMHDTVETEKSN